MPLLIKSVNGKVLDNFKASINNVSFVEGNFGHNDWIKIGHLEVFLQNFKKVINSEILETSNKYGLIANNNKTFIELEISY